MTKYDYTLAVGEKGADRLELLNELCNPHSTGFIQQTLGLNLKNKDILEIGCGIGIFACELAQQCLPEGNVLATDISDEQLAIVQKRATDRKIPNLDIKKISAFELDQVNKTFDIIYCRFVLAHLPNALEVIKKAITLLNKDGVLICEEPEDISTMSCEPPNEAFSWWKKAVEVQVASCKGIFTIGKQLTTLLDQNDISIISSKVVQPEMSSVRLKQQLWQGIQEVSPLLLASGFAKQNEIDSMVTELKELANNPSSAIKFFSYRQIAVNAKNVTNSPRLQV